MEAFMAAAYIQYNIYGTGMSFNMWGNDLHDGGL